MGRAVVGVIAGYVVWTVFWLAGNNLLFSGVADSMAGGQRFDNGGPLLGILVLSVMCSLCAGAVTATIARGKASGSILIMALLLLATGIAVQLSVRSLMPVWYHLAFLALIIPVCLAGGRLATLAQTK